MPDGRRPKNPHGDGRKALAEREGHRDQEIRPWRRRAEAFQGNGQRQRKHQLGDLHPGREEDAGNAPRSGVKTARKYGKSGRKIHPIHIFLTITWDF